MIVVVWKHGNPSFVNIHKVGNKENQPATRGVDGENVMRSPSQLEVESLGRCNGLSNTGDDQNVNIKHAKLWQCN